MKPVLQLNHLTRLEKLQAMEELWQDLSVPEDTYESPTWHVEELERRAKLVEEGKEAYISWEEAKRQLRDKCK